MNLYEILGVSQDASKAAIKKAWQKLAQKLHPDKPTGDAEKFQQTQHAYEVLSDDDKRAHYDRTGSDSGAPNYRDLAIAHLSALFSEIADGDMQGNLIAIAKETLQLKRDQFQRHEQQHNKAIRIATRNLNRIIAKTQHNLFKMVLDAKLADLNDKIGNIQHNMKILVVMEELLNDYTDTKPEIITKPDFGTAFGGTRFFRHNFNE